MKSGKSYKWCIFHLDLKTFGNIEKDLNKSGYKNIKVSIPTVSILKKRSKGKDIYEDVPMLFTYGFIRLTTEEAYSRHFLRKLKTDIPGIMSWVMSLEPIHRKRKRKRVDSEEFDDYSMVATVSKEDVKRFKDYSRKNKIYHSDEITNLKIGDYVILRGYPFEGIDATVKNISLATRKVTLILYPNDGKMVIKLPMDHVVYSIYHNYDENKLMVNTYSSPNELKQNTDE